MEEKIVAPVNNRLTMQEGPTPADVGAVGNVGWHPPGLGEQQVMDDTWYYGGYECYGCEEESAGAVQAVHAGTKCYSCGGLGHISPNCPMKGKGKGKGAPFGKGYGKASMWSPKGKGKGKGFRGACWNCEAIGHTAAECRQPKKEQVSAGNVVAEQPTTIAPAGNNNTTPVRNVETVWLVAGVATSGNKGKAFEKKNGRKKDQAKRRREAEFEDKNKFEILIEEQEDSSDEKDEMFWQNDEDLYHEKKEAQEEFRLKAQVNKVEIIEIMNVTGEKMTRLAAMDFNRADVRQPLASAVNVVKCGNRIVME